LVKKRSFFVRINKGVKMNKSNLLKRTGVALSCALLLGACVSEVQRQKTQWLATSSAPQVIELKDDVKLVLSTGYTRVLAAGSQWREAGRITEGVVFKPVDGVLTAEGRHIHEAYLVLDGERVVGFYLPVEQDFAALPPTSIHYQKKGN
jgi:hypothetical protein